MNDLKRNVVRGGLAKSISQVAILAIRVGSLMALGRLLAPHEFGLVAMAGAVTGVFHLLKDAGLSMATVQRQSVTDEQLSTLFWANCLVGAMLAALCVAIAPALVLFYHEPRLFWVTSVLGTGFVMAALGVQHSAILQRQMRFVTIAVIDTVSFVASAAVGVAMAALGFGYWALVVMAIVFPAVSSICLWSVTRWVPGRPRRGVGVFSMVRFGGTVTLNGIVVYVAYNLDKVLLGRVAGADVLGLYGRACQLANMPIDNFNAAVGGVAFAALSKLQEDPARVRRYFLKGYSFVLGVTLPVGIASCVLAEDIVRVTLGPRWIEAAPLLRFLAPTMFVFALINPLGWLLMASNRARRSLNMAFVIAPVVVAGYVVGLSYGAAGVAVGFSVAMVALGIPLAVWAVHGTVVSVRDLLEAVSRPLVAGVLATAASLVVRSLVGQRMVPLARLVVEGAVLLAVYAFVLLYVMGQRAFYYDLLRQATSRFDAGNSSQ